MTQFSLAARVSRDTVAWALGLCQASRGTDLSQAIPTSPAVLTEWLHTTAEVTLGSSYFEKWLVYIPLVLKRISLWLLKTFTRKK